MALGIRDDDVNEAPAKRSKHLESLPRTPPEGYHRLSKTNSFSKYDDPDWDSRPTGVTLVLLIMVPAGMLYLYLLFHALRHCLKGCLY